MNAIVLHGPEQRRESWLGFVWRAWSGLGRRHWAFTGLAAAIFCVTSLISSLDYSEMKKAFDPALFILAGVGPVISAVIVLLAWSIADAMGSTGRGRWTRVTWSVLIGSAVASVIVMGLYVGSGVMGTMQADWAAKSRPFPPFWLIAFSDWISTVVTFGLFVAFGEMHLVRERIEAEAREVMQAQGRVARQVLESRLAAMQAQVEPQFLFDSLVDVCGYPDGHAKYCSWSFPCDIGEGDCDSDLECAVGHCASNVGAAYGWSAATDVCELDLVIEF